MIAMYDLEDNLITIFDNYKECAKYFNVSVKTIYSHICRCKKGIVDKKRDKENKRWYRLVKLEDDSIC